MKRVSPSMIQRVFREPITMNVIMQNETHRARPLRHFCQKKYDLEKLQGRSRMNDHSAMPRVDL